MSEKINEALAEASEDLFQIEGGICRDMLNIDQVIEELEKVIENLKKVRDNEN